jgi:ABC-type branched-subunit amino acid transport system substrate-binding protein
LLIAALLMAAGCRERPSAVIGIAMGSDLVGNRTMLSARQERYNNSVDARHKVELRIARDTVQAGNTLGWANELVNTPGLIGVVGHESSRYALQAAPVYEAREVVEIVPTGTSRKLATVSPWTFPLVASDSSQGKLLADRIVASGRKRVTLLVQDDEYGRGIVMAMRAVLDRSDVQVLENVVHTPRSDFALLVRSILAHSPAPDALVLITQGGIAIDVARNAWRQDSTLMIIGSDATISGATTLRALAPGPDRLALATYWVPDSSDALTQEFFRDYREAQLEGEPQWHHAALYDAVGLLNAAIKETGGGSMDVRRFMLSLGRNRAAYRGVLGEIDFTGEHAIPARLIRPTATGWEPVK